MMMTDLNIVSATCNKVRQQQQQQQQQQLWSFVISQLTQDRQPLHHLNSLTSSMSLCCILLLCTKADFQRFLDSAAIDLDIQWRFNLRPRLITLRHAVLLLAKISGQAGLIMRLTRSHTSRSRLAQLVFLKCNRQVWLIPLSVRGRTQGLQVNPLRTRAIPCLLYTSPSPRD